MATFSKTTAMSVCIFSPFEGAHSFSMSGASAILDPADELGSVCRGSIRVPAACAAVASWFNWIQPMYVGICGRNWGCAKVEL